MTEDTVTRHSLESTCLICNKTLEANTARFCSAHCRQVAFVAMAEEAKSPDVLLVRFFFALMNEVMEGPVTPELIDQTNRMRERWQRDLEEIRAQLKQAREPRLKKAEFPRPKTVSTKTKASGGDLQAAMRLLQLGSDATLEDANRSFRALAAQYHPDRNQNDLVAENQFKKLNQAFHLVKTYLRTKAAMAR
jgi:hypothetical protein